MLRSFAAPANICIPRRELELPSLPTLYTAYKDVEAEAAFHANACIADRYRPQQQYLYWP